MGVASTCIVFCTKLVFEFQYQRTVHCNIYHVRRTLYDASKVLHNFLQVLQAVTVPVQFSLHHVIDGKLKGFVNREGETEVIPPQVGVT